MYNATFMWIVQAISFQLQYVHVSKSNDPSSSKKNSPIAQSMQIYLNVIRWEERDVSEKRQQNRPTWKGKWENLYDKRHLGLKWMLQNTAMLWLVRYHTSVHYHFVWNPISFSLSLERVLHSSVGLQINPAWRIAMSTSPMNGTNI